MENWPPNNINWYYSDSHTAIAHGDCREVLPRLQGLYSVAVTDPPFGREFSSSREGSFGKSKISGDSNTELRDWLINALGETPAILFGSPYVSRPAQYKAVLIWDKGDHVGMGDLSFPWKPCFEEVYVIGSGFQGRRSSAVLRHNAIAGTVAVNRGRSHPTEKPVSLMKELIGKCPPGLVLDPFMGSGTTLRAAKDMGRQAIGIEINEAYCEIAARRLAQEVLEFEAAV